MRPHLGAALALHAIVLAAGARWAPMKGGAAQPMVLVEAPRESETAVDLVSLPPEKINEPGATPAPPGGASGGRRSEARGSGAGRARPRPGGSALAVRPGADGAGSRPTLDSLLGADGEGAGEVHTQAAGEESSGAERAGGRSGGVSAGSGEGGGGGGRAAKKRAGNGWGEGWDNVVGAHAGSRDAVTVKADESTLARRTIGGVVARSAGRLRFCYEDGLRREAGLAGQIPVNFTVDLRGNVVVATDGGSTVADPTVVRCVLSTFAAMAFPARASGSAVRASYLVTFPPG